MTHRRESQAKHVRKNISKNSKLRATRRKLHKFVGFCQSLKDLIPTRKDGTLLKAIKLLGIVDKVFPENKADTFKELGFTKANNVQFIALVSSLNLMELFNRDREDWDEHYSIGIYERDDVGSIILFEDENRKFATDFFHSEDFQFKAVAKIGWEKCKGCMEVEKQANDGWNNGFSFVYSPFTQHTGRQFGSSSQMLEEFRKRNATYMNAGISRTYLFVGPPGVGKTTLAQKFAVTAFERILKMSSNTLYEISTSSLNDLVEMLDPQCLLIDEIDKDSFKMEWGNYRTGCSLLGLIEHLKLTYPHITIIFTANKYENIHPAMLRPGRTDDIIEFGLPHKEDRKAIIKGYAEELGVNIDDEGLEKMAECTDGLSGAWLKELVLKLRYEDALHLSTTIEKMKKYAKEPKKNDDNNTSSDKPAEAVKAEEPKSESKAEQPSTGNVEQSGESKPADVSGSSTTEEVRTGGDPTSVPENGGVRQDTGGKPTNGNGHSNLLPRYFYPSVEETLEFWRKMFEENQFDKEFHPARRPN